MRKYLPFYVVASILLITLYCSSHREIKIQSWNEVPSSFSLISESPLFENQKKVICDYDREYLRIQSSEIRIEKKSKIIHRLVYVYCPSKNAGLVKGGIKREIYLSNQLLFSHFQNIEIKPGSWEIRVSLQLPSSASANIYKLKSTLVSKDYNIFTIDAFDFRK